MDIIEYLANDNYVIVNKELIKVFGLKEAVLIGELCREYRYWKSLDKLEDDMFYSSIDNIKDNIGLSAYEQRSAIQSLQNCGVLETELKGVPAKKYFKINQSQLLKILTSRCEKTSQQDVKKLHSRDIANKNTENNNKSISKDIDTDFEFGYTKKSKTKKPTLYDKCVNLINDFTDDAILREMLVKSLQMFLENSRESGKTLYTNHFKGKLNILKNLSDDNYEQRKIVKQALDNGWKSFYALKSDKKRTGNFTKDVENLTGLSERANKKGGGNSEQKF